MLDVDEEGTFIKEDIKRLFDGDNLDQYPWDDIMTEFEKARRFHP